MAENGPLRPLEHAVTSSDEADSPPQNERTLELLHSKWNAAQGLYKTVWLFVHREPIGSATSAVPIAPLQVMLEEAYRRLKLKSSLTLLPAIAKG